MNQPQPDMQSPASPAASSAPVESDREFFAKAGPLPTAWDEARRFPRFYFRTCVQAVIHPLDGRQGQTPTPCQLLTRDLSRSGLNLLHTQQLYPGQRIDITLPDQSQRTVVVRWCRRLASRCYSLGCSFIKAASDRPAEPQPGDGENSPCSAASQRA